MFELYEWFKYHYNNWRYPPRPMTGFYDSLTDEQKEKLKNKL